ncbi:MAG: bestrophin family ion channel [Silvania sp.]
MSAIQGGCERISNTPIPFAYSLLLHRTVGIFCAIYPLLLINNFGVLTLLFSVFTTYARWSKTAACRKECYRIKIFVCCDA